MDGLQWIAEIAFRHLWQGVLIFGIAGGLLLFKEKWSAEHRSWIWAVAVLLMGIMPVATLIPTPGINIVPNLLSSNNAALEPTSAPLTEAVRNAYQYDATLLTPVTETLDSSIISREMVFFAILGLWAIFTLRALSTLYRAWQRTRDLRHAADPVEDKQVILPKSWPTTVTVAVSDQIEGPMAVGLLQPYVMLPHKLLHTLSTEQLHHVLAHELAHIKRGDLLCSFAQRILLAIYWWSPFMRMACENLRTEREMACDDRAVRMAGCSKNYASSLLDSAEALIVDHQMTKNLIAVGAFEQGKGNFFSRRIKRLVKSDYREDLPLGRPHLLGLTGATAVVALLFVLSPRTAFSAVWPGEDEAVCCDEFIEAIFAEDHERKVELVEQGAQLNCIGTEGHTPLIAATHTGDASMVVWLIEKGADVNLVAPSDGTPLMEATAHGHTLIAKKLVAAGADVNLMGNDDGTALMTAAKKGNASLVHWLIEQGADVNLGAEENSTPLSIAVRKNHSTIVKKLLAAGADPNIFVDSEETVLMNATRKDDPSMVNLLIERGADVNLGSEEDGTPLIIAAQKGHTAVVKKLLAAGADPNMIVNGDETALMIAARKGHYTIVKYLVKFDADINFAAWEDGEEISAITEAKRNGHGKIASYLKAQREGRRG